MHTAALTVRLTVTALDRAQLEQLFDLLGELLMERQGDGSSLLDHSVSIDLGAGIIEIGVTTAAKTAREAEALAGFHVEDVLRASGGAYTPDAGLSRLKNVAPQHSEFGIEVTARELVAVGSRDFSARIRDCAARSQRRVVRYRVLFNGGDHVGNHRD